MKKCKIKGCEKEHLAKGWCSMHYRRNHHHGDPLFSKKADHVRDGRSKHPLYSRYWGMINRCHDENDIGYQDYGGRGIKVCQEWRNDFWAFVEYIESLPSYDTNLDIDRINNSGNYEPGNIRFITHSENCRNTRKPKNNTSGFVGVSWEKAYEKWRAAVTANGKFIHLGYYDSKFEAVEARIQGEIEYWGGIKTPQYRELAVKEKYFLNQTYTK